MLNTAQFNINSSAGSHTVFVQQDANNKRTIKSSVDGQEHILYECSANDDGDALNALTDIHVPFWVFRGDRVVMSVDVANNSVTLDISQASIHYSGVLGPGESAKLVAFVKDCKKAGMPDLGA